MLEFAVALLPIITLILVGFTIKQIGFLSAEAWAGIEKLTYFVLFPSLLVRTLGMQVVDQVPWTMILAVVAITVFVSAAALLILRSLFQNNSGPEFTSIFQGGVRFNTYITLAVSQSFFGAAGLAQGSVAVGFMIVLVNVFSVSVFLIWGRVGYKGPVSFLKAVLGNPLIVACVIGGTLSLTGIGLSPIMASIFEIPGRAALPLGLLAVGAALKPELLFGHFRSIAHATWVQFGLKPLTAAFAISYFGLSGVTAGVLVILFISPTSPSSYILARQLGGDTEVMASIITFQTLLAFVMMPVLAALLIH